MTCFLVANRGIQSGTLCLEKMVFSIQVHETCRINYHGRPGLMVMDEGIVIGGYTDIFFYDDDGSERIRLFGGSLFNSQHEQCKQKFKEFKEKYAVDEKKKIENPKALYPSPPTKMREMPLRNKLKERLKQRIFNKLGDLKLLIVLA